MSLLVKNLLKEHYASKERVDEFLKRLYLIWLCNEVNGTGYVSPTLDRYLQELIDMKLVERREAETDFGHTYGLFRLTDSGKKVGDEIAKDLYLRKK